MKIRSRKFIGKMCGWKLVLFACLLCSQGVLAQQPTELAVSMKTPEGKYIGQVAGGGLDAASSGITGKQTFVLVDMNGGKIAEGDQIKIKIETSQWHEDKEKSLIHRVAVKGAKDEETVFKLHIKGKLIYFETPSGKFVKVENGAVVTTSDAKDAALFDIQPAAPANQSAAYTVALKFANGNLLGSVSGGGLDASATEIGTNQIFSIVDINGGTLSNGDSVKIIFAQSQMREDKNAGKILRVSLRGAKEDECVFKILVVGKNILIQTPSGKFAAASADGKSIVTTDKKDESSLLTAVPTAPPTVK